jgi:hypothetical protein
MTAQSKVPFAVVQKDAEQLVAEVNGEINRAYAAQKERMEQEAYARTVREVEAAFQRSIPRLRERVAASKDIPLAVDPEVVKEIETEAKVQAYEEAQAALVRAYSVQQLSFDQYIKATRDLARIHFQNTLFDVLQTE